MSPQAFSQPTDDETLDRLLARTWGDSPELPVAAKEKLSISWGM